jgi:hypothetical protein
MHYLYTIGCKIEIVDFGQHTTLRVFNRRPFSFIFKNVDNFSYYDNKLYMTGKYDVSINDIETFDCEEITVGKEATIYFKYPIIEMSYEYGTLDISIDAFDANLQDEHFDDIENDKSLYSKLIDENISVLKNGQTKS